MVYLLHLLVLEIKGPLLYITYISSLGGASIFHLDHTIPPLIYLSHNELAGPLPLNSSSLHHTKDLFVSRAIL